MRRIAVLLAALFTLSCSYASLHGFAPPAPDWDGRRFMVMHQPNDQRNIHHDIVNLLLARGMVAEPFPMESPDFVVTYIDKWFWDLRTYMVDFRVDVHDANTGVLLGTGRSFQTSLDAMGHTYQDIVENALRVALEGP